DPLVPLRRLHRADRADRRRHPRGQPSDPRAVGAVLVLVGLCRVPPVLSREGRDRRVPAALAGAPADPSRRVPAGEGPLRAGVRGEQSPTVGPDPDRGGHPAAGGALSASRARGDAIRSLHDLARVCGVQSTYRDAAARTRRASVPALMAVLRAVDVPLGRPENAAHVLRDRRQTQWRRPLEPVAVAWDGRPPAIGLRLPARRADRPLSCCLRFEGDQQAPIEWTSRGSERRLLARMGGEDAEYSEAALLLPLRRLPLGYHRLTVEARGISASSLVISAPRVVPPTGEPGQPPRTWGVFLPLHALRSARSWGAGDFTDLDRLVQWTGRLGGRSVATLPLLATFPDHASAPSPYSPASRLFWNELFLDVTAVPEVALSDQARALLESTRLQREVA